MDKAIQLRYTAKFSSLQCCCVVTSRSLWYNHYCCTRQRKRGFPIYLFVSLICLAWLAKTHGIQDGNKAKCYLSDIFKTYLAVSKFSYHKACLVGHLLKIMSGNTSLVSKLLERFTINLIKKLIFLVQRV